MPGFPDKSKDRGKRSASASRPPKPPPRAGRDESQNPIGPVKYKVRLVSLNELCGWKKRPSPILEEDEEGEKQDEEIGEKFLNFAKRDGRNLGKVEMYCSQNGLDEGRGDFINSDCSENTNIKRRRIEDERNDLKIKKEEFEEHQSGFNFSMWVKQEGMSCAGAGESIKISSSCQTEDLESTSNSNESTYRIHCLCCCKKSQTRESSTQTILRIWIEDWEDQVCLKAPKQSMPVKPPTPSPHLRTPHEEEIDRRRSVMFEIHRELSMKFKSSKEKKVVESTAPSLVPSVSMGDVEEVSISIYSNSLVDNKGIDIGETKTGFSSDDTGNSGEFPSLEEDREKVEVDRKDTTMQDCIGEEFEGAERMSDQTLSDTDFGDISPISFLNDADGMKCDDKDSSIFSSSIKYQIKHVSGHIDSDSALTISVRSSGSESRRSSDRDIAEKHDLCANNQSVHISRVMRLNVGYDGDERDIYEGNLNEACQGSDSAFAPSSESMSVDNYSVRKKLTVNGISSARNVNVARKHVVLFNIDAEDGMGYGTHDGSTRNTFNNTSLNPSDSSFPVQREASCFWTDNSEPGICTQNDNVINLCDSTNESMHGNSHGVYSMGTTSTSCLNHIESGYDCHDTPVVDSGREELTNIDQQIEPAVIAPQIDSSDNAEEYLEMEANVNIIETLLRDDDLKDDEKHHSPNVDDISKTDIVECNTFTDDIVAIKSVAKLSSLCARVIFDQQYSYYLSDDIPSSETAAGIDNNDVENVSVETAAASPHVDGCNENKTEHQTGAVNQSDVQNVLMEQSLKSIIYVDQLLEIQSSGLQDVQDTDLKAKSIKSLFGQNSTDPMEIQEFGCDLEELNVEKEPPNQKIHQPTVKCNRLCTKKSSHDEVSEDYGYDENSPYVTKKRPRKRRTKSKAHREPLHEVMNSERDKQQESSPFSSIMSTSYDTACGNISDTSRYHSVCNLPQAIPVSSFPCNVSTEGSTPRFTYSALETARANLSLIRRVSARAASSSFDLSDTSPETQFSGVSNMQNSTFPGHLVCCRNPLPGNKCLWVDPHKSYPQEPCLSYYCYCKCGSQLVSPVYSKVKDLPYFSNDAYNSDESDLSGSWCAEDAVPNEYRQDVAGSISRMYRENSCDFIPTSLDTNSDSAIGNEKDPEVAVHSPSKCSFDYSCPDLTSIFSNPQPQTEDDSPDSGYRADAENTQLNNHLFTPIGFDSLTPSPTRSLSTINQFLLHENICDVDPSTPGSPIPSPHTSPDQSRSLYTIFESSETTQ